FASAAASSSYLTVSETFPLEVRALAIAFFFALGTGIGGVAGPWLFGALIDTGSRWSLYGGYLIGSVLMLAAAVGAARLRVSPPTASASKASAGRSPPPIERRGANLAPGTFHTSPQRKNSGEISRGRSSGISGQAMIAASTSSIGTSMIIVSFSA